MSQQRSCASEKYLANVCVANCSLAMKWYTMSPQQEDKTHKVCGTVAASLCTDACTGIHCYRFPLYICEHMWHVYLYLGMWLLAKCGHNLVEIVCSVVYFDYLLLYLHVKFWQGHWRLSFGDFYGWLTRQLNMTQQNYTISLRTTAHSNDINIYYYEKYPKLVKIPLL